MKEFIKKIYENREKIASAVVMALTLLAICFGITSCSLKAEKLECQITGKCL